jgi:hypothetical protein
MKNCSSRFKDLDDLSSIFQKGEPLDLPYLAGQMQRFSLAIPKVVRSEAPEPLRLISMAIERGRGRPRSSPTSIQQNPSTGLT